jgi:hypothetical protein
MAKYPESAQLAMRFDTDLLTADLDAVRHEQWGAQRPYGQDGARQETEIDWRILPLRSIGGDPVRTDPGGAGLDDFADTQWLQKTPYFGEVIARVPAPVRGVRLMALGPGAAVHEHCDGKYGFSCGVLRLHVPVLTNPGSVVVIDGQSRFWDAGRLWFGDFGRLHYVANNGDRVRVHMVIDCLVTRELIGLFPLEFRDLLPLSDVMIARNPIPLAPTELDQFCCQFAVPVEFPQWSEEETEAGPDADGAIEVREDRLVLTVDGKPEFSLVHLGLGEFRLTGWTEERTIVVGPGGPGGLVRFRVRNGRRFQEWTRPVR